MIHHNNNTGFWVVDIALFLLSIICGILANFAPDFMPLLSANIAYYFPIATSIENFDNWLHRIVVILSGIGALSAIVFGYLNYKRNKKK